mmetsp:Transcript_37086/g.114505  ORF Transcript_37086/g.114505 Transcript_37086/m.114505 type:complete len:248 (+) Transcript_37086:319-1062(+)
MDAEREWDRFGCCTSAGDASAGVATERRLMPGPRRIACCESKRAVVPSCDGEAGAAAGLPAGLCTFSESAPPPTAATSWSISAICAAMSRMSASMAALSIAGGTMGSSLSDMLPWAWWLPDVPVLVLKARNDPNPAIDCRAEVTGDTLSAPTPPVPDVLPLDSSVCASAITSFARAACFRASIDFFLAALETLDTLFVVAVLWLRSSENPTTAPLARFRRAARGSGATSDDSASSSLSSSWSWSPSV